MKVIFSYKISRCQLHHLYHLWKGITKVITSQNYICNFISDKLVLSIPFSFIKSEWIVQYSESISNIQKVTYWEIQNRSMMTIITSRINIWATSSSFKPWPAGQKSEGEDFDWCAFDELAVEVKCEFDDVLWGRPNPDKIVFFRNIS